MSDGKPAPVDKLVRVLLKMRVRKGELKREYDKADADVDEQMDVIKSQLLEMCAALGTSGLKTDYGTVTRTTKTRYWSSDWVSMHKFCVDHGALDLLERRIHQTHMKQFLEEHVDLVPPGLNADSTYDISVTKPRK